MEPYIVNPLYDSDSKSDRKSNTESDRESNTESQTEGQDVPDILPEVYERIEKVKDNILTFKQELYKLQVGENTTSNPESLEALASFHSQFLQCIAYLIGILYGKKDILSAPGIPDSLKSTFHDTIVKHIESIKSNTDTNVLLYDLLSKFSTMPISQLNFQS